MNAPGKVGGAGAPALEKPMAAAPSRFKPVPLRLPKPSSSRKRLRRRQILVGLIILPTIVIAGTALTVREFLQSDYLAEQLAETLRGKLAVGLTIGSIDYRFPNKVIARDLVVFSPEPSNHFPHLLEIPRIDGRLQFLSLLSGRIELHSLIIEETQIFIELDDQGVCTLVRAIRPATLGATPSPEDVPPGLRWTPPEVTLKKVLVTCCPYTVLKDCQLEIDLKLKYLDAERTRFSINGKGRVEAIDQILLDGTGSFAAGDIEAKLQIRGLQLDDALRDRLTEPSIIGLWDEYRPRGTADLVHEFVLTGGEVKKNSAEITLAGGKIQMVDPVIAISNVKGKIKITPGSVSTVGKLEGKAFSGNATLEGQIELLPKGPGGGSFELELMGLSLEPSVADDLPGNLRKQWDRYKPNGTADLHIFAKGDSFPPEITLTHIDLREVDLAYEEYPYPLENLSGTVALTGDGAISVSLTSPPDSTPNIRIEANAFMKPGQPLDVTVDILGLTIDEVVATALPPTVREIFDEYSPTGLIDLKVWVIRDEEGEKQHVDVMITARDATIRHQAYPLLVEHVTGSVLILRDRVELRNFQGRHGDSEIILKNGDVVLGDQGLVDLTIESPDLVVDSEVIAALPDDSEAAIRAFGLGGSEPNGSVQLSVVLEARGADPVEIEVNATIHDPVRMVYEEFPYPMVFHTGKFLYNSKMHGVKFSDLQTSPDRSPIISIFGDHTRPDEEDLDRRELFLQIDIEPGIENRGLHLSDPELVDSLPADLKLFSKKMELDGLLTASVEVRHNVGGVGPETVSYVGDLQITDGSIDFGLKLKEINATFDVSGGVGPEEPHNFEAHFKQGSYRFTRFFVEVPNELILAYGAEHPAISERKKLIAQNVPEAGGYLPTLNLIAKFPDRVEQVFQAAIGPATMYGGELNGFFFVDLADDGRFKGEAECRGLDLSKGSMDIFGTKDIAGIANGRVDVEGRTKDAESMVGLGLVEVTAARLSRVPALAAVFLNPLKALSRENQNFHKAEAKFLIRDQRFDMVELGDLRLVSEVVEVLGKGTLNFENYIDLILEPQTLGGLPILSDILNSLTRFRMRGNLDDPEIFGAPE